MKEGLLGGIFSTGWPLLNLKDKPATLAYREATIDGRRLHEIDYHPKQGFGDMKIKLYFDMETYRHVRTEYRLKYTTTCPVRREDSGPGQGPFERRAGRSSGFDSLQQGLPDSIYVLVESSTISRKSVR